MDVIRILDSIIGSYENTAFQRPGAVKNRPYYINAVTILEALQVIFSDVGQLNITTEELLNGSYTEESNVESPSKINQKYNSVMDVIKILDSIIGKYDELEVEDNENKEDIVSYLNFLNSENKGRKNETN
jgi:hypothetical protein